MEDNQQPVSKKLRRASLSSKWRYLAIGLLTVTILSASFVYFIQSRDRDNPFPKDMRSKVSFKLYYPSNLDKDIDVVESSFKLGEDNKAILYTLHNDKTDTSYYVSIQEYPSDFDFVAYKKKFGESNESVSPVGSIFTGDLGSQLIASLRTNNGSWVIISTPDTTAFSELENLAASFRLVD